MAIAIVNQWTATSGDVDHEIPITPTDGNWLVACVAWRTTDGVVPQMSVGDLKRNLWTLGRLAVDTAAGIGVQVWVCPVVKTYGGTTKVYVAPSFIGAPDAGSVPVNVAEVSGLTGGLTIDATVVGTADAASSLVLTAPAPGGAADCLMVAAAVVDTNTAPAPSGTGWTALTGVPDGSPNVGLGAAWREATTGGAVTFTLAGSHSWAGVCVSIRAAGALPAVTPDWGAVSVEAQLALGYDQSTPVSAMRWLTLSTVCQAIHAQRGLSAELGSVEASPNTFDWINDHGAFTPRAAGSAVVAKTTTADGAVLNSNPDFETSTSGWNVISATLTRSSAQAKVGSWSGLLTSAAGSIPRAESSPLVGVTVGQSYRASGWLFAPVAIPGGVSVNVNWFDGSSVYLSTSANTVVPSTGSWFLMNAVFTAPAGAAFATVVFDIEGTPGAGVQLYADDVRLAPVLAATGAVLVSDVEAAGFTVGDFVRLQTYLGALKEDTVFQITAMSSAAGATTVSFTPSAAVPPIVGDVLAGVPIDAFTPVRTVATVDGKTYPVMVGTSEAIPQTWLDGTHGRVQMTAVDAYASLTATIPNVLDGEYQRARPAEFWPLDDPQGAGRAANAAEDSNTVLVQKTSKFGAGSNGAADFGASTSDVTFGGAPGQVSTLFGSSASGWGQTGLASGDTTKGFALVGESDNFPPVSGGVTIVGLSCLFFNQPTGDATVVIIRNRDPAGGGGAGSIIKLSLDVSALAAITVWDKDTHASTRTLCSAGPCIIGNSGWEPWALTFTRTAWTLTTAGGFRQSGTCDLVDQFNIIDVGGEADQSWNGHCGNGLHSRIAIYDRVLTQGEITQIQQAGDLGLGQTTTIDGTIRRQLSRAGWSGARILPRTDTYTSEDNGLEGAAVGEVVAQIATWEDGLLSVDAAGYLRFLTRDLLDRATSKFTLGPNTGAGEIPYLGAPTYDVDGQLLFTEIDIQNTARIGVGGGGSIVDRTGTFPAVGPLAATKGIRPRPWPTHLTRIYDAYNLGQWLVARYGVPQLRIKAIQVDPRAASGTAGWHAVLGAEVGDLVTAKWAPGGAPAINTRCIIIGITHDATPSRWLTTFVLMVAPDPGIILDDLAAGVISSGTLTL